MTGNQKGPQVRESGKRANVRKGAKHWKPSRGRRKCIRRYVRNKKKESQDVRWKRKNDLKSGSSEREQKGRSEGGT